MDLQLLTTRLFDFSGITDDSRRVGKNFIFVAVRGLTNDGHDFINQAVKKGAAAIVGEEDLKLTVPYIKVKDSRVALGEIASKWYHNASNKLKIVGVTGTKGKTTTAYLIFHILNSLGLKTGLVSSIAAKIGNKEADTGFHVTSPDVISLHKFLKNMADEGCKFAVLEVSSHGIDQKRIAGVKFEVGVLTNIAPEHLDYHKTFEEYKRVKMKFINSAKFKVISPKKTELNILPGRFNNLNVETALKVVELLGISRKKALKSLESFALPSGRLEEIENKLGFRIFVDFAHTPESLAEVLKYLRTISTNKVIAVFGAAGERDPYKRPKMGRVAAELSDIVVLTSEDPRTENAKDIIDQIKSGMETTAKVYKITNRKMAIAKALKLAQKGDIVALFGKGHEQSMNLDGKGEVPWSDQKVVREYISKNEN